MTWRIELTAFLSSNLDALTLKDVHMAYQKDQERDFRVSVKLFIALIPGRFSIQIVIYTMSDGRIDVDLLPV